MSYPQGILPILPLKNTVIFPGLSQMLKVGRERSLNALKIAESKGFWIVCVQQKRLKDQNDSSVQPQDLHQFGTLCRIESVKGQTSSGLQVIVKGVARVEIEGLQLQAEGDYLEASASIREDLPIENPQTLQALLKGLQEVSIQVLQLVPVQTEALEQTVAGVEDLGFLTSLVSGHLDIPVSEKQKILEMVHLKDRTLYILNLLKQMKESLQIQNEIREKFNQKMGETQRQAILREQLKTIRSELGEGEESSDGDQLKKALDEAGLPEAAKEIADKEWKRLQDMGNQNPESHVIRNYLQLMAALPWNKSAPEKEINLDEAREILEEEHFGLEKVKKRIIQQLAVMKLKKSAQGSILLLVGPPGVGKTSLGQSIAKALGRKYARISLGGVRDDSDIRGHRRTYIGAMPGRIISALKRVGENNPVFVLDEIDKLVRHYGDPAGALLEVLDPEQNTAFTDHFLDVGFDLSKVLFICTANQLDTIPAPLLDRMEVIEVGGYTTAEKLHIARKHLLPKSCESLGVPPDRLRLADDALLEIISKYTREAGVRELKRQLDVLLKALSEKFLEPQGEVLVRSVDLENLLGPAKFEFTEADVLLPPGVSTGLAWSPYGGSVLYIESTALPGNGQTKITGQLGDVMKESVQIAHSLVMSHLGILGVSLDPNKFSLHVHFPEGAIPKDGPSAGIAIFTSLMSLLTQRPVLPRLGMTGELTLRGAVNPVGGIKEKVIAAHRAGLHAVILPEKNRRDLKEIPEEVKQAMKIHFVSRIEEVIQLAFGVEVASLGPKLLTIYPPEERGSASSTSANF